MLPRDIRTGRVRACFEDRLIRAADIAERTGLDKRTVYRHVKILKNAGVPIIGDRGIGYMIWGASRANTRQHTA